MSDKLHLKAALRELANSDGICEDSAVSVRCILTALVTGKTTGTNVARIGDVIYMPSFTCHFILAAVGDHMVAAINLVHGTRRATPARVESMYAITQDEMEKITDGDAWELMPENTYKIGGKTL